MSGFQILSFDKTSPPTDGQMFIWNAATGAVTPVTSGALHSGSGAPGAGLGSNGDFYIDTAATALYGPKAAGAWGSGTSLIGAAGATGPTGALGFALVGQG